jgi:hypothetical protein
MSDQPAAGSVVIPAHNEARVIGRLLARLTGERAADDLEVIVVANGCTDDTVQVANSYGPGVRVVELAQASKRAALDEGDRLARAFPRVYVDADVELSSDDVRSLIEALREPGILAAAPELTMELTGRPWLVRWYYDVWTRLPEVRSGLFGRGVFGVSEEGYHRLTGLPPVIGDDLAASLAFQPAERAVVPQARTVVHAPRTGRDLLHRRVRAVMAVSQIERTAGTPDASSRTSWSDLAAIVKADPRLAPRVAVFLAVAVLARRGARRTIRRSGYSAWLRDESSRQA